MCQSSYYFIIAQIFILIITVLYFEMAVQVWEGIRDINIFMQQIDS